MSAAVAAMNSELAPARLLAVNERDDRLRKRVNTSFTAADMPLWATGVGSMVCIRSTEDRLVELPFHAALDEGLYIARQGFTALSVTSPTTIAAHSSRASTASLPLSPHIGEAHTANNAT